MSWLRLHLALELGRPETTVEAGDVVEVVELGATSEFQEDDEDERPPIGFGR